MRQWGRRQASLPTNQRPHSVHVSAHRRPPPSSRPNDKPCSQRRRRRRLGRKGNTSRRQRRRRWQGGMATARAALAARGPMLGRGKRRRYPPPGTAPALPDRVLCTCPCSGSSARPSRRRRCSRSPTRDTPALSLRTAMASLAQAMRRFAPCKYAGRAARGTSRVGSCGPSRRCASCARSRSGSSRTIQTTSRTTPQSSAFIAASEQRVAASRARAAVVRRLRPTKGESDPRRGRRAPRPSRETRAR